MKRKELLGRLIGEVTNFLLDGNPLRLVVSLHQEEDGAHLTFFDDKKRSEAELKKNINKALHPKQERPELAEYYGLMAGHDVTWDSRLKLIGWQIKHADVDNSDSGLRIDLWLGSDAFNPEKFSIGKK